MIGAVAIELRVPALAALTARQRAVVCRLARGQGRREIASSLGIGVRTVHRHIEEARGRLLVETTADLLALVGRNPAVTAPPDSPVLRLPSCSDCLVSVDGQDDQGAIRLRLWLCGGHFQIAERFLDRFASVGGAA